MNRLPIYPTIPMLAVESATRRDRDAGCTACKLHEAGPRTVCMPAEVMGDETGETLLVVGSYPNKLDDQHGRPYMGTIGAYIRKLLAKEWDGAIVFAYALRCPAGTKKPTVKMYRECRGYLASTYDAVKPDRVILMGSEACNAFLGRGFPTMSVRKGYAYTSDNVPVMLLTPPGPALRNRFLRGWFEEDLRWALTAKPELPPRDAVHVMVTDAQMAAEVEAEVRAVGAFSCDIETFGHSFNREHTILTVGVTPFDKLVSYIWDVDQLDDPEIRAPLARILEDPNVGVGGANWKFDCVHLQARYGICVQGTTFDVKLQQKILQADADAKLKNMQAFVGMVGGKDEADEYVAAGVIELGKMARTGRMTSDMFDISPDFLSVGVGRLATAIKVGAKLGNEPKAYAYAAIPKGVRSRYGGTDAISTDRIRARMYAHTSAWARDVWATTVAPLHYAITQMEFNGIAVSRRAIDALRVEMDLQIGQHRAVLEQFAPDMNFNSNPQVGKLLFETLELPSKGKTKTGEYATTAGILEALDHPAAAAILGLRKSTKFKTQYANGMELFIRDDGRIHPKINLDGTSTGRPSCSNPNLLNIPRPKTVGGKLCRDIYVAPPGRVLIEGDQSQIEVRVAAILSGDPLMIDLFNRGVDFHLATAKLIAPLFKVDPDIVDADHILRDHAKTANFQTLYDDSAVPLAMKLGISRKMAEKLRSAILGQFKRLAEWIAGSLAFGRKHGYSRTWWDGREYRMRPLWRIAGSDEDAKKTAERSTWNSPIQGSAAEFTNMSLALFQRVIEDNFLPCKMVLTVYDSILLDCEESAADEAMGLLGEVMTSWNTTGPGGMVPLKVDFKLGCSWGSLENVA